MNPILIDYILNWLAPAEYKLELKNRLENLCSLSGTPMSPGLSAWMTDTFGLEMTRVVQDYSTFSSPKLSPDLLSVVDRIVPSNYQGYDANLGLKQLFDVGCECLYVLTINAQDFAAVDFTGWTLNGNDFITELANYGTVFQYQNDTGSYSVYVYYTGTEPTDLNVTTNMGDVLFTIRKVTDFEGGSCDYVCYQALFDNGYEYRFIDYFASGAASPRYFVAAQGIDYGQLAPFLGPQITVTSVWNGSQYVVTINNAFNLGGFQLGDGAAIYTPFTALPC